MANSKSSLMTTNKLFDSSNTLKELNKVLFDMYLSKPQNYMQLFAKSQPSPRQQEQKQKTQETTEETKELPVFFMPISSLTMNNVSGLSEKMLGFLELCRAFPALKAKMKITSDVRPGATTSSGEPSFHASGEAVDIIPTNGNFDDLAREMFSHPEIIEYLSKHNLGILDETNPEVMARTKATGKHWHIGPDKNGLAGQKYSVITKYVAT